MLRGKARIEAGKLLEGINVVMKRPAAMFSSGGRKANVGHICYSNNGDRYWLEEIAKEDGAVSTLSNCYKTSEFMNFLRGFYCGAANANNIDRAVARA